MIDTARGSSPIRLRTVPSRTPCHATAPTAPSVHCVPDAGVPCCVPKKERPLPVHSWTVVSRVAGSERRSPYDKLTAASDDLGAARPSPKIRNRYVDASTVGVEVWLRTNSRGCGVRYCWVDTESQRISALVP